MFCVQFYADTEAAAQYTKKESEMGPKPTKVYVAFKRFGADRDPDEFMTEQTLSYPTEEVPRVERVKPKQTTHTDPNAKFYGRTTAGDAFIGQVAEPPKSMRPKQEYKPTGEKFEGGACSTLQTSVSRRRVSHCTVYRHGSHDGWHGLSRSSSSSTRASQAPGVQAEQGAAGDGDNGRCSVPEAPAAAARTVQAQGADGIRRKILRK